MFARRCKSLFRLAAVCLMAATLACGLASCGSSGPSSSSSNGSSSSDCPYEGDYALVISFDLTASQESGTMEDPYRESGTVHVDSDTMTLTYESEDGTQTIEGTFSEVTDRGVWMYQVDRNKYLGIGENTDMGATFAILAIGGATPADDIYIGILLEPVEAVAGSDAVVGVWESEYGTTVEFTPGGTMIGSDSVETWYNFYTIDGDVLQLTGIPDCFLIGDGQLTYVLDDYEIPFYPVG